MLNLPDTPRHVRTRPIQGTGRMMLLLGPAVLGVALLFGGGVLMALLQGLGYLPGAGMAELSWIHFQRIFADPDFSRSLGLTFYIAGVSTLVAGCGGVATALALNSLAARSRWLHFVFQIPLTVPHLVIAVAVLFMLSPAGLFSRAAQTLGLIHGPGQFPLLVNDPYGIGIMVTYVWKEIPFITLMVFAVLGNTGRELLEVGRTLKAGPWQRFRYITLPTIFPSLAAASLIVFAYTFGAFEVPYLLGRTHPLLLPVQAYKQYSDVDLMARPEGIATGLIIALVVVGCILLAQALTWTARSRGVSP
ncbi:MAG: ABC transporter permease subunit [Desulfobacterales bacterium]